MSFLLKILLGLVVFLSATFPTEALGQNVRQLRFMSYMLRDQQPTVAEAKAFYAGSSNMTALRDTWLGSADFTDRRLHRFFNDWFGVGAEINIIQFSHYLPQNADGVFYHAIKGECATSDAVSQDAWWTPNGEKIQICPNLVGSQIYFEEDGTHCSFSGSNGLLNAKCGCGPQQVLCAPSTHLQTHQDSIRQEFAKRAVYVYKNSLTWDQLLAGKLIIGDRYNYHSYLITGYVVPYGAGPTSAQLATMRGFSMSAVSMTDAPIVGPERAGVVTSPGFMAQFNNFRSRVRALSERLLCRDIDGGLNTDGISVFLNNDLSDFDKEHGTKEGCASCHFPMDNLGSTLLGWDANGFYQQWLNLAQTGWSFGQQGTGPEFMMKGFVARGPGFTECMATRVWEDFTGAAWADLSKPSQDKFLALVPQGPRSLIDGILTSEEVLSLRSHASASTTTTTSTSSAAVSFETDVTPILERSCAGSGCHSSGTNLGTRYEFLGNASNFKQTNAARITDGSMPPATSGLTISADEQQLLIRYINQ